jgi:alpha-D-ribose 1-methylphosphonate 5-triphosphate synthase subunit PhnH
MAPAARQAAPLASGFADPARDSQRVFRALLDAMAEPGTIHAAAAAAGPCPGFSPAMTAVALTIADFETTLWTDLGADSDAATYLRFHTGAPIIAAHEAAAFAFVTRPLALPALATFAQGSLEYPDTSTTIVIDVEAITGERGWRLTGPGVKGERQLAASPLRPALVDELAANRKGFPLGVDLILCCGNRIAALPRSTTVTHSARSR